MQSDKQINQSFSVPSGSDTSFDPQEYLFEKKQALEHFFITVY